MLNENVQFKNSTRSLEAELKAEVHTTVEKLKQQSTLGAKILRVLLQDKSLDRLEFSEKGFYGWLLVVSNPVIEVGICFWGPQLADSRKHSHFHSRAWVIPLAGSIVHKLFHISGDKFYRQKQEELKPLSVGFIPSHAVHQVLNKSDELSISLHIYCPNRPSLQLEED